MDHININTNFTQNLLVLTKQVIEERFDRFSEILSRESVCSMVTPTYSKYVQLHIVMLVNFPFDILPVHFADKYPRNEYGMYSPNCLTNLKASHGTSPQTQHVHSVG